MTGLKDHTDVSLSNIMKPSLENLSAKRPTTLRGLHKIIQRRCAVKGRSRNLGDEREVPSTLQDRLASEDHPTWGTRHGIYSTYCTCPQCK
jgi:hypothetical protein